MYPTLSVGPLLIQTPLLAGLIGIWLGLYLAEKEARRLKLPADPISNLIFIALVGGVLGARLAYASRYLDLYLADPLSLVSLNPAALDPLTGLLVGLAAASFYARRKRLPLRPTLDALAPGLAVFMLALGAAHLLSGDAYGAPADLPWSIYLWNEYRHPAQLYETLAALLILLIVLKRPVGPAGSGVNFLLLVALSAAARLFLEAFRGDSLVIAGGLRVAQVVSLGILLLALWLMKNTTSPPEKI